MPEAANAPGGRILAIDDDRGLLDSFSMCLQNVGYLVKPCSPEQLCIAEARQMDTLTLLERIERLEREVPALHEQPASRSPAMRKLVEMARQVARTDANVLLLGASGTGKGVLASAIHDWSPRAQAPFATINCPSLSAELLESELFGHAKGPFTGATQSTQGRVSNADGGTLFLDAVGDFPLALQPKLLRIIQDKVYERIGDPTTRRADVRIVSATNRNLELMVHEGQFRLDLMYRLNVIALTLPPLRERGDDIEELARGFLHRYARNYHLPAARLAPAALARMRAYSWPGNVRELQNVIERAVILSSGEIVGEEHLSLGTPATLDAAARTLGIDSSTLYRKRKAFGR